MEKPVLILLLVAVSQLSLGQVADKADIGEVIVIGELSRPAVRTQIIRVETDIYNFYNANNGNKKLNIVCRQVALTGTRIPQRVCEPVFLTEARSREVRRFIQEFDGVAELQELEASVKIETDEMNAVYASLIEKYSPFAEALLVLEDLKARLEELGG
jgi:predicted ABC-class ATPase